MSPGARRTRSWLAASCLAVIVCLAMASLAGAQPAGLDDVAGPLRGLALDAAAGRVSTQAVSKVGIRTQGNLVQAQLTFTSPAAAAATGLAKYGGQVQFRRDRRVQAMLPADQVLAIAALPQVSLIAPVTMALPQQGFGAVTSQGVQLTQASSFHYNGITGSGVTVGVIDLGFANLTAAEVPVDTADPEALMSFRADGSTTASSHGTAVAQVIADMAPGCTMILMAVDSELSIEAAIDYCIAQDIKVVNMSLGFVDGPFDGTHPLSLAVNRARAAGVFWVNSAGNFGTQHWHGIWRDDNADNFLEFDDARDYVTVTLPANSTFQASLSWFQSAGGTTSNDYDLVLTSDSGNGTVIARSAVTQNGDDAPSEPLLAYITTAGIYRLRVERMRWSGDATDEQFQLYVATSGISIDTTLQHSDESLAIPAEATGSFTVGATRGVLLTTDNLPVDSLESFSSRGPENQTNKPDLVAPDGVSTSLAAPLDVFFGTSAAAPHVAGAAALLLSEDQTRSAWALSALMKLTAYQIPNVPDTNLNGIGAGRLALRIGADLDAQAPAISIEFPGNNSTISVASPRVVATMTDKGGINPDTVQIWLDGNFIVQDGALVPGTVASDYVIDTQTGDLSLLLNDLQRTRHTISMQVADLAGNVSDMDTANFRITQPTIAAGVHIIGLPYPDLSTTDPSLVFGLPLEDMALVRWVPTDSRTSKYHIYPDEFASFSPPDQLVAKPPAGLGYFLRLGTEGNLQVSASGLTDSTYEIKLIYGDTAPRGWNLIGNPYEDYIDWGSVEFQSTNGRQDLNDAMDDVQGSPVTEGVLFDFVSTSSGGYYSFPSDPTLSTMEPLKGYWLHVLKPATLLVHNSGNTAVAAASARRSRPKAAAVSASNWLLQLEARAGKYEDPVNYIGVSTKASDGYDAGLDASEPPPLVDSLRMYMATAAGNFAKDLRSGTAAEQTWTVEVACRLKNAPVTVSWPQINSSVPRGVSLRLEDVDSGESVYMRTATGYTFTLAEPGVRHLKIVASTGAAATLAVSGLAAANAHSGGVALTYTVSRASDVTVEIRNMSGVLVRTLAAQSAAAGTTQTALWNGKSDRGMKAPAGKYFARVTARAADGQTVQAISPFSLTR